MEKVAETRDYGDIPRAAIKSHPVNFEIVAGLHLGGAHRIREGEWLLFGSADDCDVLLADPGIAAHHCLIGLNNARLNLRSLEGVSHWEEIAVSPGESKMVLPYGELKMGDACIRFMSEARRQPVLPPAIRHYAWVALSLLLSTSATYVMAVSLFGSETSDIATSDMQSIETISVDRHAHDSAEQEKGQRIAASVRDIMRLSGIDADVQYVSEGTVEVTGFFGDGKRVANAVQSRAVREIKGLKRVQVVNKTSVESPPLASAQSPLLSKDTKMVKIIYGSDPYLVVTDGSRYYPGARLPDGSTLVSILDKEAVMVKSVSGEETLMSVNELF